MTTEVKDRFRERSTGLVTKGNSTDGAVHIGRATYYDFKDQPKETVDYTASGGPPQEVQRTWDYINPGPPFRDGGSFITVIRKRPTGIVGNGGLLAPDGITTIPGTNNFARTVKYRGGFYFDPRQSFYSYENELDALGLLGPDDFDSRTRPNDLSSAGNSAYAKLRPKVAVAGLGQAIAEARDVPHMLKSSAHGFSELWDLSKRMYGYVKPSTRFTKKGTVSMLRHVSRVPGKASDHFINHQFGWLPFLKDVGDTINLVSDYQKHLANAEKHNGVLLHRRFTEKEQRDETLVYRDGLARVSPAAWIRNVDQAVTVTRIRTVRMWYVGAFTYYYPELDTERFMDPNLRVIRQGGDLAGANIDPTLLYKVTPWTWLVDWFSNSGQTIQRAQDLVTNSVVTKYMYLMRHITYTYQYKTSFTDIMGIGRSLVWESSVETKERVPSLNPFGFSLNFDSSSLSDVQKAILIALGIARL
jgi:hypothetical protein